MLIPQMFHVIWLGTYPIPAQHQVWLDAWSALHPEWKTHVWGDEVVDELPGQLRPLFEQSTSWSGKSDIARVTVVHKYGGVYRDTDYRPLRPIDPLLLGCRAFAMVERPDGRLTGSLFGAVAEHPFLTDLIEAMPNAFAPSSPMKTGPLLFNDVFYRGRGDVRLFERSVFAPIMSNQRARAATGEFPDSFAVHAYAASWVKKRETGRRTVEDESPASTSE